MTRLILYPRQKALALPASRPRPLFRQRKQRGRGLKLFCCLITPSWICKYVLQKPKLTGIAKKFASARISITARMKHECLFLKVGYITLPALPCSNFTAELSHCKKLFIKNDRIVSDASKTTCGISFSARFSAWALAPFMPAHTSEVELLRRQTVAPRC